MADDIIADARELGKKIAAHPKMTAFVAAVNAVRADGSAEGLLKSYREKARQIESKAAQGKPVEVDEKHALADLERQVASHPALKEMIRCEADYLDLMRRINDAIDGAAAAVHTGQSGA